MTQTSWPNRVALLGAGQIGSSVLAGLLLAGLDPSRVHVTSRSTATRNQLRERFGVHAATSNIHAVRDCDLVMVAVRVGDVTAVLDEISGVLSPATVVMSLAGAPKLAELAEHLPAGTAIYRCIPNSAAALGAGLTGLCGTGGTADQDARVRDLLAGTGEVIEASEPAVEVLGALGGHGQAVVYYAASAAIEWGVAQGLARGLAHEAITQAVVGAGTMLADSGLSATQLRELLCTPGGTTVRTGIELDARGVRGAIIDAMEGAPRTH